MDTCGCAVVYLFNVPMLIIRNTIPSIARTSYVSEWYD